MPTNDNDLEAVDLALAVRSTALHEAGHALMAHLLPAALPVRRVRVHQRGGECSYEPLRLPPGALAPARLLEARVAVVCAGMLATELLLGHTEGAAHDLETLGRFYQSDAWRRIGEREASKRNVRRALREAEALVHRAAARAELLLRAHRHALERIADYLLAYQQMDAAELDLIVRSTGRTPLTPGEAEELAGLDAAAERIEGEPVELQALRLVVAQQERDHAGASLH